MIQVLEGWPSLHEGMRIQQEAHPLLPPCVKLFRRQRLEKLGSDSQLAFPSSRFAIAVLVPKRDQAHDRLVPASDDDILAPARLLNEARKIGFGFADGHRFHRLILPVFTSETHGIIRP